MNFLRTSHEYKVNTQTEKKKTEKFKTQKQFQKF